MMLKSDTPNRAVAYSITLFTMVVSSYDSSCATAVGHLKSNPSHCKPTEKAIFNCTIGPEAKLLSICGASSKAGQLDYLQYRFGRRGKPELVFPEKRQESLEAFKYSRYTRPRTTYISLMFEKANYKYTVYQDDDESGQKPQRAAGVRVDAKDRPSEIRELKCQSRSQGSLMVLEDIVPHVDETDE